MLMNTRPFFAAVVAVVLFCQLDVLAQGRNAVLGGRAKRTQGGGVKQSVPGLTGTRKRTLVNQVVTGVVNSKPNSNSGKRQVTNLQRRLSLRVPIRISNVSGEPIGLNNIYMWGLKGSSLWTMVGGFPRLPGSGAEFGTIVSYDAKFDFYVINRGADHGIKIGDEYNVLRGGNLVGKIKINTTQPTVSIADAVKAFTRMKLQAGDKVAKAN